MVITATTTATAQEALNPKNELMATMLVVVVMLAAATVVAMLLLAALKQPDRLAKSPLVPHQHHHRHHRLHHYLRQLQQLRLVGGCLRVRSER